MFDNWLKSLGKIYTHTNIGRNKSFNGMRRLSNFGKMLTKIYRLKKTKINHILKD
jgi:hypothetical protein